MAKNGNSGGSGYLGFAKTAAFAALAGAVTDAFCEVSHFPGLNDPAPVALGGGPNTSNAELIIIAAGVAMSVAGFVDLIGGVRIGGMGKELLPAGLGLLVGEHYYESDLANMLGIRGAAPAAATPKAAASPKGFSSGNYDFAGDIF